MREKPDAMMHGKARTEATRLQRVIAKVDGVSRVEIAGSLRRQAEIVQDIDLVAACDGDRATAAAGAAQVPGVQEATVSGPGSLTLRMIKGERVDVHCVPGDALTVALWRATGSAAHVEQVMERLTSHGFSLDDNRLIDARGSVILDVDEPMIYRSAGLAFVPPELREHRGEIEAAESGHLPRLIELGDLRGVLHCHSRYSDGATTIEEMATAAQARGWKYLGISDHSQAASYAGGMVRDTVLRQHDEIDTLNQKLKGFRVLKGIESDILADGSLDYDSETLDRFDYVIGSVHSRFSMDQAQMTTRILRAMDDPHLTIIGHPTGRLLLRRQPFAVDLDAIMERAAEAGIALELNCDPNRLDLDWRLLQEARRRGVTIEIGPDAHAPDELGFVEFGMQIARKGWLEAGNVLNTGTVDDIIAFAQARRNGNSSGGGRRGS
jgi:DNA polymerase (family 10)